MQIGSWSRWLTDMFGMDTDDSLKEYEQSSEDDCAQVRDSESKSFLLLNELSDLLMLPKDMLMDRSIREEVCFFTLMAEFFLFLVSVSSISLTCNLLVSYFPGVPINWSSIG